MIPKVRHISHYKFISEQGTLKINYCGYDPQGKNWDDEWMRNESLHLALPYCSLCLKEFKEENGIDYSTWRESLIKPKQTIAAISPLKKVSKRGFYEDVKKLREYL